MSDLRYFLESLILELVSIESGLINYTQNVFKQSGTKIFNNDLHSTANCQSEVFLIFSDEPKHG